MVMIGEVRVPASGGLPSIDLCSLDTFDGSRKDFCNFTGFSTRSRDLKERLNMAAVGCKRAYRDGGLLKE